LTWLARDLKAMLMQRFYPESRFGGFTALDGTVAFYTRVQALLEPGSVLVDFGCGRGAYGDDPLPYRRELRIFKGRAARVIGLDASPAGASNPFLDEFHPLQAGAPWPLPNDSADLLVCDNVLEHLPEPDAFFSQAWRVLRPGGVVCIRTPNRWNYIALISQLIPNRQHARVLSKAKASLREEDVFPTFYRCNSLPAMRSALQRHHFMSVVLGYEAEPSYLSFSALAYTLGVLHQKLAPEIFRAAIFAFGRK
jgi:SAM-dependent methyltransferase